MTFNKLLGLENDLMNAVEEYWKCHRDIKSSIFLRGAALRDISDVYRHHDQFKTTSNLQRTTLTLLWQSMLGEKIR
jgi:hypothetical protein